MQDIDYGLPGTYGPNKLWDKHKIIVQRSNQAFLTWSFHNHSKLFPKLGYELMGSRKTFLTAIFLLTPFPADLCKEHPRGEENVSSPRTWCLLSGCWCSATVCFLEAYHLVVKTCSSHLRFFRIVRSCATRCAYNLLHVPLEQTVQREAQVHISMCSPSPSQYL